MVQAFRESDWRGGHYYVGGILHRSPLRPAKKRRKKGTLVEKKEKKKEN